MGLYDPQMRVSTSGTGAALARNYALNAANAGRVLTSQGDNLPPIWAAPAGAGVLPVNHVLFVDAVNSPGAGATGTLGAPFQTLQAAINQAVLNGWDTVQLQVAFETYAAPLAIPVSLVQVSIVGWDALECPILSGDITYTTAPAGLTGTLEIVNCLVTAANIQTANVALQSLNLTLINTINAAAVAADTLLLEQFNSTQEGNATGTTALFTRWDGHSWATTLQAGPVFAPPGYSRFFFDAGHDTYRRSLTANAVPLFPAVGSTVFVTMAMPAFVRAGDYAEIQVLDPAVQDFNCGVHGVGPGSVTVWLTNLSRAGLNFNEAIQLLIHHEAMVAEPAP